ncbi:hypothetical protein BXO88_14535 [Oribacterium sp. C9]|uniref:O-antigen polymerase n=1 Tax=Oribacterium sp. C9 TaxID=1943579 RepID=UPI00098F56F9|nr:O-antigen polymerase [Oribacterium sp. C9]OON85001.1 hypothetical protein BXO88_14535 [Oribacterium sp. C9]
MIIVLPIVMLLILLMLNAQILKSNYTIFNPISIVLYVWIVVFISHHMFYTTESYTFDAYLWIVIGICTLSVGFWITANVNFVIGKQRNEVIHQEYNLGGITRILKAVTVLEIMRLAFYIYHILFIISGSLQTFISNNTYVRYRYLTYNPGLHWSLFEFFANSICMVSYVFLGILFAKRAENSRKFVLIWTLIEILIAMITMSRLCLMMYIIAFGISYLYNTGSIKEERKEFFKFLPLVAIGVFSFLMFIGMQRNYMASGNLRSIVIDKIFIYFAGPTEAFGKYIELYKSDWELGQRTFAIFARILDQFGIVQNDVVTARGTFIDIGDSTTNVYTWFRTFYLDYSYIGIIIIPFLFGILSGAIYNKRDSNFFTCAANSWICVTFFFSFFSYMWGKTIYVFVIVLAYFIHRFYYNEIYLMEG